MRKYLKLRLMVAILAVSCIISACGKKEENKDEVTVGNVNATVGYYGSSKDNRRFEAL
ncbi:MAG: hypothetical protein IJ065_02175 [Eubacterium sp.]|nr:hypothetical protein [Eubacterium sp.]